MSGSVLSVQVVLSLSGFTVDETESACGAGRLGTCPGISILDRLPVPIPDNLFLKDCPFVVAPSVSSTLSVCPVLLAPLSFLPFRHLLSFCGFPPPSGPALLFLFDVLFDL